MAAADTAGQVSYQPLSSAMMSSLNAGFGLTWT
jgi:hypothetical protein